MVVLTRSLNHILYAEKKNKLYWQSRSFFLLHLFPALCVRGWGKHSAWISTAHIIGQKPEPTYLFFAKRKGKPKETNQISNSKRHVRKEKTLSRKQTETLTIRLTAEEKMELQKKMYEAVSPSMRDFILKMCRDGKVIVNEELRELNRELKYQGNNLNQLTRLAHQNRFSSADLSQLLSVYRKILAALGGQNHGGR